MARVGAVPVMGAFNPSLTRPGKYPVGSRCPWVRRTKSISTGGKGKGPQLSSLHSLSPWNNPESTRMFLPGNPSKNLESVTVPAPPKHATLTSMLFSINFVVYITQTMHFLYYTRFTVIRNFQVIQVEFVINEIFAKNNFPA